MNKVAVFLDGANFFRAKKNIGCDAEAERILKYCQEQGVVIKIICYTAMPTEEQERKFYDWLESIGYSLVTKPIKENFDLDITLDMFRMMEQYDIAILFSKDDDFADTIDILRCQGKAVKVISDITSL